MYNPLKVGEALDWWFDLHPMNERENNWEPAKYEEEWEEDGMTYVPAQDAFSEGLALNDDVYVDIDDIDEVAYLFLQPFQKLFLFVISV